MNNHPINRFPEELYNLLCNPAFGDILCWLPHGKSWIVLNQNAFVERIIRQKHFFVSDYDNFIQCVNKWGFKQVKSGIDVGSYYHRLFIRDQPHLIQHLNISAKSTQDLKPNDKLAENKNSLQTSVQKHLPNNNDDRMNHGNNSAASLPRFDCNPPEVVRSSSSINNHCHSELVKLVREQEVEDKDLSEKNVRETQSTWLEKRLKRVEENRKKKLYTERNFVTPSNSTFENKKKLQEEFQKKLFNTETQKKTVPSDSSMLSLTLTEPSVSNVKPPSSSSHLSVAVNLLKQSYEESNFLKSFKSLQKEQIDTFQMLETDDAKQHSSLSEAARELFEEVSRIQAQNMIELDEIMQTSHILNATTTLIRDRFITKSTCNDSSGSNTQKRKKKNTNANATCENHVIDQQAKKKQRTMKKNTRSK